MVATRREEQRAASEAAIVDAAWALFARRGPEATTLRDIGADAGCTHALVLQHFGTKVDLVGTVATLLGQRIRRWRAATSCSGAAPLEARLDAALGAARTDRATIQLLIRSGLGDLPPRDLPGCLGLTTALVAADGGTEPPGCGIGPDRRERLCAYAAASLLLGVVTFEPFLIAATGAEAVTARSVDRAMAHAAVAVLAAASSTDVALAPRQLGDARSLVAPLLPTPTDARQALLTAAVERFAARGPTASSVRDIARHAEVNQGLIYRHFGSKEALVAEALDAGISGLFPAALAVDGFDFDAMSWLLHHASPAPRLIARTLVDDVDITVVRRSFPVVHRLLDRYDRVPSGAGPGDLSDPRLAVGAAAALALGSAIWGALLRPAFGLGTLDGVDAAVADLARLLVELPDTTTTPSSAASGVLPDVHGR